MMKTVFTIICVFTVHTTALRVVSSGDNDDTTYVNFGVTDKDNKDLKTADLTVDNLTANATEAIMNDPDMRYFLKISGQEYQNQSESTEWKRKMNTWSMLPIFGGNMYFAGVQEKVQDVYDTIYNNNVETAQKVQNVIWNEGMEAASDGYLKHVPYAGVVSSPYTGGYEWEGTMVKSINQNYTCPEGFYKIQPDEKKHCDVYRDCLCPKLVPQCKPIWEALCKVWNKQVIPAINIFVILRQYCAPKLWCDL